MSSQGTKRSLPTDEESSQSPRPRKRPGGASRLTNHDKAVARDALLKRQYEREQEAKKAAAIRGVHDVVRQHYNAVPQRGRDWRKTESRIKGLRSFNNWVKSTIIHKFSPNGSPESGDRLRILDLGCGKGGDLGKWQQAPQPVELLVGIDPAEVSIEQARERYMQMRGRGGRGSRGPTRIFDAEFYAQDAFGQTIGTIPIIQDVGYDAPNSRRGGGFDVVSMMFCMHYAFESEAKTRGMLQNVSGSLKKGGRFIGAIPSSDVIRAKVQAFYKAEEALQRRKENAGPPLVAASIEGTNPASTQERISAPAPEKSPASSQETIPVPLQQKIPTPPQEETAVSSNEKISAPTQEEIPEPAPEKTPIHQEKMLASTHKNSSASLQVNTPVSTQERTPVSAQENSSTLAQEKLPETSEEKTTVSTQEKPSASLPEEKTAVSTQAKPSASLPEDKPPEFPAVAEWGNSLYRIRFSGPAPKDGMFRPPFGWKYSFFLEEAVEVPEYVVPWEAFRA